MPINGGNGEVLSAIEEVSDANDSFAPHVDTTNISSIADTPSPHKSGASKAPLKSFKEIEALLLQQKKREVKIIIRENNWPINSPVRPQLWPALCAQHQTTKEYNLDGFYWEQVNQVFGTTELPEKPIMLPPFVDSSHCLPYYLNRKGHAVADRIVSVLGYTYADITYSPMLYPVTAILLHYMSGK